MKDVEVNYEEETIKVIPVRNMVLFPGILANISVGRDRTTALCETIESGDLVAVVSQKDPATERPERDDVYDIAVIARVHRKLHHPRIGVRMTLEGLQRARLGDFTSVEPFTEAEIEPIEEEEFTEEADVLAEVLLEKIEDLVESEDSGLADVLPEDVEYPLLADRVAAGLGLDVSDSMEVLATLSPEERLRHVISLLGELKTRSELKTKIESEVREELSKKNREALLRQQLKAIKKELGQGAEEGDGDDLRQRLESLELPPEGRKVVDRELKRLEALDPAQSEYNVIEKYLELIADLPWAESADVQDDLDHVSEVLEADHYGLNDVKERILEHMAVLQLSGNPRGTILCLAGPPGVGKTSLGESVADATGRPFVRISLGGVRDESEIRGHRRTYVGSLPGRIISAIRNAGKNNPVMLLDEVDKLGRGFQGDPEAALLEVLDPAQNSTFTDHYLDIPFDLSNVLFICTANYLENISAPLRDRLEIIEITGYTPEEKVKIARNHLIPTALRDHAIEPEALTISDDALRSIITKHTREAGVRQLNRQLTKLCRALALEVVRGGDETKILIDEESLETYLGKKRFHQEVAARTTVPGVATGLAWTPVGGDILFVETSRMHGKGSLQITGQLGDVMQESAKAALTYVRSNAEELEIDPEFLEGQDVHIHVPAGAVPKDGPSAGVTIFTALTSLLTGRNVRPDTAMTGECTLRGRVLPVGGIKAKVLAAHRAGIKQVILPKRNEKDLDDVPDEIREGLDVVLVEDMSEALDVALESVAGDQLTMPLATNDDNAQPPAA